MEFVQTTFSQVIPKKEPKTTIEEIREEFTLGLSWTKVSFLCLRYYFSLSTVYMDLTCPEVNIVWHAYGPGPAIFAFGKDAVFKKNRWFHQVSSCFSDAFLISLSLLGWLLVRVNSPNFTLLELFAYCAGKRRLFHPVADLVCHSTFFLMGPRRQLQSMFHPTRLVAAAAYFGSMVATLYTALSLQATGLTLLCVIIQLCAAVW